MISAAALLQALRDADARAAAALSESAVLSLAALKRVIREDLPRVRYVQFAWSDQGDYLAPVSLWDADLLQVDYPDYWELVDDVASHLTAANSIIWQPYMVSARAFSHEGPTEFVLDVASLNEQVVS